VPDAWIDESKDEVALEYYRLQKIREGTIVLEKESESALHPITEAGTKKRKRGIGQALGDH
jgi:hypothetical protein